MRKLAYLLIFTISLKAFAQDDLRSVVDRSESEHINYLHQREWVRLGTDGTIAGKLLSLSASGTTEGRIGAKVVVSRDGEALFETVTDEGGQFKLDGLEPGAYAIQCRGDYTFAAYALHVLPTDAAHLSSDLEIYASVLPQARATELLAGDLVPEEWEAGQDSYYRSHAQDPIANERKFNNSHQVVLRDGALVGRVSRPGWSYGEQDLSGTVAQIVRDGEVVAKAAVGSDGYYEIKNVVPGVYDLFVTGDDGFAVLAFEAVAPTEPVALSSGSVRMVSTLVGMASDCLCCELIHQPEINACCAPPIVEEVVMTDCGCGVDPCACAIEPACGSGFAGGFQGGCGGGCGGGGGGGMGGGLGGIGGLLGVAGLAVGVAALSDDDNGFTVNLATPLN